MSQASSPKESFADKLIGVFVPFSSCVTGHTLYVKLFFNVVEVQAYKGVDVASKRVTPIDLESM